MSTAWKWKNREWVKYLDPQKVNLLPIQFANADRLQNNNVVFIFDEVGCGKTISAGIVALDWLEYEKRPIRNSKVLVITEHALAGSCCQFALDWRERLPFAELGYEYGKHFVVASNNLNANNGFHKLFEEQPANKYGLIIVDEHEIIGQVRRRPILKAS